MPGEVLRRIISNVRTPRDTLNLALSSKQVHLVASPRLFAEKIDWKIRQGVATPEAVTKLLGEIERTEASARGMLLGRLIQEIPQMGYQIAAQKIQRLESMAAFQHAQQSAVEQFLEAIHQLPDKHRANPLYSLVAVFKDREARSVFLRDPTTVFNRLLDEVMRLPDLGDQKEILRYGLAPSLSKLPVNARAQAHYRLLDAASEIFHSDENRCQSSDDAIAAGVPPDDWLSGSLVGAINFLPESARAEAATRTLDAITKPGALSDDLRMKLAAFGAGR
ncbi:hypothetical protein RO07_20960 [Pandoraea pulmonicola]|uniref:F-box domain-containing protein n=5 Tax=Pandoraea pulmonicola TaxID=93221 RepID=A0ABN4EVN9_PANPU|nr:hypothetical protein RO07_20960 [Pandoraea pulmonicola]